MLKKILCITALLVLAACVTDTRSNAVAVTNSSVAAPASLKATMAVGQITGGGSYLFDPDAVRDSEFKNALEKSLAAQGLLADDNAAYKIEADIKTHLSDATATTNKMAEETVVYHVLRVSDQKTFEAIIKTTYEVPGTTMAAYAGSTASAWGHKKIEAFDKVTSDNIAQFLQKVAAWDQG